MTKNSDWPSWPYSDDDPTHRTLGQALTEIEHAFAMQPFSDLLATIDQQLAPMRQANAEVDRRWAEMSDPDNVAESMERAAPDIAHLDAPFFHRWVRVGLALRDRAIDQNWPEALSVEHEERIISFLRGSLAKYLLGYLYQSGGVQLVVQSVPLPNPAYAGVPSLVQRDPIRDFLANTVVMHMWWRREQAQEFRAGRARNGGRKGGNKTANGTSRAFGAAAATTCKAAQEIRRANPGLSNGAVVSKLVERGGHGTAPTVRARLRHGGLYPAPKKRKPS